MEFKNISLKYISSFILIGILFIGLLIWRISIKTNRSDGENIEGPTAFQNEVVNENDESEVESNKQEDKEIQEQFDQDRQQQKLTKVLRIKLEQTNIELEQEKALTEIYKLKKENVGTFKESAIGGQNNLPEIKVEFIGGDSIKKEAILSISGSDYKIKEKTSLMDNIKVMSISDSSVTLHFSSPQELTKTIEYKPEL